GSPFLSDWSMDGRFLSFVTNELVAGGALHVLPLEGERKPVEVYRGKRQVQGGWFSPDSRFLSFTSNDSGRNEVYVTPRDGSAAPVRITDQGPASGGHWRRDGRELYMVRPDQSVMAVEVSTSPAFQAGKPTLLFRQPVANHDGFNISRD